MSLHRVKLTKVEKKEYTAKLYDVVGRIGIVRTLRLLAKAIRLIAKTADAAYHKRLVDCLEGHYHSVIIAKNMCTRRVKEFRDIHD